MARAHDLLAVAHTHGSPILLLRVCLRSKFRRETGRWPSVSKFLESRLRFAASGPHSPPRRRTRGRRSDLSLHPSDEDLSPGAPAALARKERFREHLWPVNCLWPWGLEPPASAGPAYPYASTVKTHG